MEALLQLLLVEFISLQVFTELILLGSGCHRSAARIIAWLQSMGCVHGEGKVGVAHWNPHA